MSDESFEETFTRLRVRYCDKARERCDGLERLLALLEVADIQARVVDELRQSFHKFSGSGATYGFARVSELGLDGELTCDALLKRDTPVSVADVDALRKIVVQLRGEFGE